MDRLRIAALSLLVLASGASPLRAQESAAATGVVDRIVAVVGDSAVLKTDLDEEVFRMVAASGQSLPEDPQALERLYREALETKIDELLVLQAAARDSVAVDDAEVDRVAEQELARQRQALGGERAFADAVRQTGMTVDEYREELERQIRRQRLIETYLATIRRDRRPPPVTDAEAREYFDAQRSRIGRRPATLSFEQVIVRPQPTDSARAAARAEAEQVLAMIRDGADFEEMARRYTDEPGGRERGGDLGWFRLGQMVPEFERVAFSLPPGAVSGIVETTFGFHIIKVEKVKGGERQARHILFRPEMTDADYRRTEDIAREVAERMRRGEPVDSLVARYGDPSLQSAGSLLAPRVGPIRRDALAELPAPYASALADVQLHQVVEPFRLTGIGEGNHWVVLKITGLTEAGEYTWDDPDLRSRIREQLERQKLMDEIIRELRERTYVDVRF
ncbi:MAG TPA: peptidylprolyl isomerase [Longimicrobiales bacterium]